MATTELRQRAPVKTATPATETNGVKPAAGDDDAHPSGSPKHGRLVWWLRLLGLGIYFNLGCLVIHATQIIGSPLYLVNRNFYYAYQSLAKASFGVLATTMTNWWAPTLIRVSGDASVAGQLSTTLDGRIRCEFPERLVLIANHQIYTDWLYLWWVAYTNAPQMHGHIYIILKESLRWIPVIGPGCMYLSFIFMSRKMQTDRPRLAHRLAKLNNADPMWLLLFPEGTNLSANGRRKSAAWAERSGQTDHRHVMIPRSTGTYFCLTELKGSVDFVYDCTVAYEGIPRGKYGEDYFTLSSTYFEGRPPKSVNFHWRRFAVDDIPLDQGPAVFDEWIRARWAEKDELMEHYLTHGKFPTQLASPASVAAAKKSGGPVVADGYIETEVRTEKWWEFIGIFTMLGGFALTFNVILKGLRLLQRLLANS